MELVEATTEWMWKTSFTAWEIHSESCFKFCLCWVQSTFILVKGKITQKKKNIAADLRRKKAK